MSYAIGYVIYGVASTHSYKDPLTFSLEKALDYEEDKSDEEEFHNQLDDMGIQFLYSSSGDQPWYFGIDIAEIDETKTVDLSDLINKCDGGKLSYLKAKYIEKFNSLPEKVRMIMPGPSLMIVWGSS